MSSKETVKAIIEVLKDKIQDINHVNDEVISSLNEQITKIIESMGYVKQERYEGLLQVCLLYTSPSPRDPSISRMPSSA